MDALSSWWNVALANTAFSDSQLYQKLADGPEDWGQVKEQRLHVAAWMSAVLLLVLDGRQVG